MLSMTFRLVSAMGANILLVRVAILNAVVITVGDYLLMKVAGVPGLALASVLAMVASLILVILELRKRVARNSVLDFKQS